MEFDILRQEVENEYDSLVDRVNSWKQEMLGKIKNAENNTILAELKKVNIRLDEFERRLPSNADKTLEDED